MKVTLSVVGMYFNFDVDVPEDASVEDVLKAAEKLTKSSDSKFSYELEESTSGAKGKFIKRITVDYTDKADPVESRKKLPGGKPNKYEALKYEFVDSVSDQSAQASDPSKGVLVWQYYIFDPSESGSSPQFLGDTVSDDGIIHSATESANAGYQLKEGSTVVLRCIALFGKPVALPVEVDPGMTMKQYFQMT